MCISASCRGGSCALLVLACVWAGAWQRCATAAGFGLEAHGPVEQGTAFAGASARADGPSTLAYNPAGIVRLDGYQVSLGATLMIEHARFASGATASTSAALGSRPILGTTGENAVPTAIMPNLFATTAITPDVHLGLSVTSQFGSSLKLGAASIARYYLHTDQLRTVDVAPTIAYRIADRLGISATLHVEQATSRLSSMVDFGGIGAASGLARLGMAPGRADGQFGFRGDDVAVGWQLGALYLPWSGTQIGLEYHSAITHRLDGSVAYTGVPRPLSPAFPDSQAHVKLATPARVSLGAVQTFGSWSVLAEAQWNHWSVLQTLVVQPAAGPVIRARAGYRDSWLLALGAEVRLSPAWTVRAGTALDTTPTSDADRAPSLPDGNRVWLSTGATWRFNDHVAVSLAYSHIFVATGAVALRDLGPGSANAFRGNLNARSVNAFDDVGTQVTFKF